MTTAMNTDLHETLSINDIEHHLNTSCSAEISEKRQQSHFMRLRLLIPQFQLSEVLLCGLVPFLTDSWTLLGFAVISLKMSMKENPKNPNNSYL